MWTEFDNVVCTIVDKYTMVFGADAALSADDEILKHSKLFIRDALTFWIFSDAIRNEDIGLMWLVYHFWLFMFCGAGCHNYGNELLEMIAQFWYGMDEMLRRITERTWLVNRWGKVGRAIPTDLYLEHNNGFIKVFKRVHLMKVADHDFKCLFAALGSCASVRYIQEKCSGPVELLRKLSRDVATYFEVTDPNRTNSTVDAATDIRALMVDLKESQVHTFTPGRKIRRPAQADKKKKKKEKVLPVDIFTEGKEVLECGAFRDWKNRAGKFGADLLGCDAEYLHEQGVAIGDDVVGDEDSVVGGEDNITDVDSGDDMDSAGDADRGDDADGEDDADSGDDEVYIVFDVQSDLERENEA